MESKSQQMASLLRLKAITPVHCFDLNNYIYLEKDCYRELAEAASRMMHILYPEKHDSRRLMPTHEFFCKIVEINEDLEKRIKDLPHK